MTQLDCKNCTLYLPDLLLDGQGASPEARAHLVACEACQLELRQLQDTMALMDAWTAPEPSAFFDTRVHAQLRSAAAEAPEGLWQRLTGYLHLGKGRMLRPALAGAFGLALLAGGGTVATKLLHHGAAAVSSPTVNDLRIYDNNAQAVQQMDMLDENAAEDAPQS